MKIFITGHTSGIGKALYDMLSNSLQYEVAGGSRSTGWDITNREKYKEILEYDVLVNSAHHVTGQLDLLKFTYSHWQNKPKTIINVGSAGKDLLRNRPFEHLDYNVSKKSLETYSFWICSNDNLCRSMMYNPGFVDTPLARDGFNTKWPKEEQEHVLSRQMDPTECAKAILFMIESKHTIKELTHSH